MRDGSKIGVFIYCQEHAREWATPLVCLETAERLVRNYATDPRRRSSSTTSTSSSSRRSTPTAAHTRSTTSRASARNMANYCARPRRPATTSANRNSWGVDLNRNFSVGSLFDGYSGASSTSCTERHVRRPVRALRARDPQRDLGRRTRSRTSSSRSTSTPPAATSCGRRAPTSRRPRDAAVRRTSASQNFFDQTADDVLVAHQELPRHGDPAAADRPGRRRALLGRRQLGRRAVYYRTASSATTSRPAPSASPSTRRRARSRSTDGRLPAELHDRGPARGDGVRRRQLRPAGVRAGVLERHVAAGRGGRVLRDVTASRTPIYVRFNMANEAS